MDLPIDLRHGIPASEPRAHPRATRRTTTLRLALGLALLATLAAAVVIAFRQDVRYAPLVPSGTAGMLVLDMSASVYEGAFDQTVAKLVETDERIGLVVFSDAAYELLPPGSPGRELRPLLRYFRMRSDGTLPTNPWDEWRAGTQISVGLQAAREALLRENVEKGSVILLSDLEVLPDEVARMSRAIAELRNDGIDIRIVPLFPREEKRALVEQLVGKDAFLAEPEQGGERLAAPDERTFESAAPWLFGAVALLLVALLTANERFLSRLEVRR
jgi:hypothetical protein